jgi:5-methylcytosine-specific restriction endonuclease McrA
MTIAELGERDGWRCHLCRKRVYRRYRAPDPRSPTFDHLIPVSDHGDDAPENLRLAHLHCNSKRGAGGVVQLLLVG